jgi:hypothetical protein
MNFKQIIEAWAISFKPSEKQKEMAEDRLKICTECPARKKIIGIDICEECGCPITKKAFTNAPNPCPLKKWEEIDKKYFKEKTKKTLL